MAENWEQNRLDILADFSEDGTLFTFTRTTYGEYDPFEGAYIDPVKEEFTAPGFFSSFSASVNFNEGFSEHSIENGDLLILLANTKAYAPIVGDYITIDDVTYVVQAVSNTQPSGLPLTYRVSVTKG